MPLVDTGGGSTPRGRGPRVQPGHNFQSAPAQPSTSGTGQYNGGSTSGGGAPTTYSTPPTGQVPRAGNPAGPQNGGGGNGNGNGGNDKKKKNNTPTVGEYLGTDEQYQADRADLIRNYRNLKSTTKENRGNLRLDKTTTLQRLGTEQADALEAMKADFAARGLFGGAEYQQKLGDFNEDYSQQQFDTKQSFQRNIAQLLRELRDAGTLKNQNLQQARLEAIRRRASEYGITG